MTLEMTMILALVVPLIGMPFIIATGKNPNLRETMTLTTAVIEFALVASLYPHIIDGAQPEVHLIEMLPGAEIVLKLEPLGMLFAGIASFLWIITSIYSIGYMRGHNEDNQTRFYAYFAVAIFAAIGVAFSGNLITLFLFYEILTVSTYPLVSHAGTEKAKKGARVYMGILIGTSVSFFLLAILWTYNITGGVLDFMPGGILEGKTTDLMIGVLLALYAFGIGKAALMPFHRWLPAAMVAPTPVSALLHAVAVVKAGVFSVVKVIVYVFGFDFLSGVSTSGWLVYIAGFTIISASVIAMRQDNIKRRLAYSTVSQLSYVVIAAAILTPLSVTAAAMHIAAHAFGKITLFFCAGSIMVAAHKTEVSQLDGIGKRMPWTMAAFTVGALSMIGVPPTAGFVSKWYLLQGALQAEHYVAICVVVLSTLLNAGYFLPIVYKAFFKQESQETADHPHGEAPLPIRIAVTLTATGTILLFLFPDVALDLAKMLTGVAP